MPAHVLGPFLQVARTGPARSAPARTDGRAGHRHRRRGPARVVGHASGPAGPRDRTLPFPRHHDRCRDRAAAAAVRAFRNQGAEASPHRSTCLPTQRRWSLPGTPAASSKGARPGARVETRVRDRRRYLTLTDGPFREPFRPENHPPQPWRYALPLRLVLDPPASRTRPTRCALRHSHKPEDGRARAPDPVFESSFAKRGSVPSWDLRPRTVPVPERGRDPNDIMLLSCGNLWKRWYAPDRGRGPPGPSRTSPPSAWSRARPGTSASGTVALVRRAGAAWPNAPLSAPPRPVPRTPGWPRPSAPA